MKRILLFALLGLLLFGFFIVHQLPATYITSRLPGNVVLQGVEGSIWQGEAALLSVNNQPVGKLNWQWQLAPLLSGQWGYRLEIAGDAVTGNTRVALGFDQQLTLSQLALEIDGAYLSVLAQPNRNMHLSGVFVIDSPEVAIKHNWPVSGSALILWQDAGLYGDLPMQFGALEAAVTMVEQQLVADLKDNGGALELDGTASLSPQREYQVDLRLRARAEANDNLRTSLKLLSAPDLTGRHRVVFHGGL